MAVGSAHGSATLNYWVRNSDPGTLGSVTVGLHSGDPGSTGTASEFTAGTNAYVRQSGGTFGAPAYAGGTNTSTATASVTWANCPPGTISSISVWAGATFVIAGSLTGGQQPITAGNSFTLSSLSVALS